MKLSEELLRAVADLEVRARRSVTALLSGNYRSPFRGSGMQFKEFRRYEAGDDIRHMSWSVTARTGKPTMKTYEEERDLDVILVVDVSGSSLFGAMKKRKIDMYAELAAVIGLSATRAGDNFGLLLFSDKPLLFLRPQRGRSQVLIALDRILSQPLENAKSDLAKPFLFLQKNLKQRSLIIVISDFLLPSFRREMATVAKRHDVILLHCFDDAERGSRLEGVYEIWDPEADRFWLLNLSSPRTRDKFAKFQTHLRNELEELCRGNKAELLSLSVEDDYLQRLVRYFKQR